MRSLIEGGFRWNGMHCGTINSPGLSICYQVVLARSVATAIWAIVFRRRGDLEIPGGDTVARFAGTFWRLVQYAQALLPLGRERRLGESFQDLGRRFGQ